MWLVFCLVSVNIAGTFEDLGLKKNVTRLALPFVVNDEWNLKRTPKQIETVLNTINETVIGEEYVLNHLSDLLERLLHLLTQHKKVYHIDSLSKSNVSLKENDRRDSRTDDDVVHKNKTNKIRRPLANLDSSDFKQDVHEKLDQSKSNILLMKLYELRLLPFKTNLDKQPKYSKNNNLITSFKTPSIRIETNVTNKNSSDIFSVFNKPHLEYKQMPFEEVFRSSLEMPLVLDKVRKGLVNSENRTKDSTPTVKKKVTKSSELIKLFTPKGRFLRSLNGTVDFDSIVRRIKNKYPMLKPYLLKQYAKLLTNTEQMELNHADLHQHELHLLDNKTVLENKPTVNNSKSKHQNDKNFYEIYFEEEDSQSKQHKKSTSVINKEPRKTDSIPLEFQEYTYRPPRHRQNIFAPKLNFSNKGFHVSCQMSNTMRNSLIRPRLQHARFYNIKKLNKSHKQNEIPQRKDASNIFKSIKEGKSFEQHNIVLGNNIRKNQTKLKKVLKKEDNSYEEHQMSHEPVSEISANDLRKENGSNGQLIIPLSKSECEHKAEKFKEAYKKLNKIDTQYGILPIRVIEENYIVLNNDTLEHSKSKNHLEKEFGTVSNENQTLQNNFNESKLNQQSEEPRSNITYEYTTLKSNVILNNGTDKNVITKNYKKDSELNGQHEIPKKYDTEEQPSIRNYTQEQGKINVQHDNPQRNSTVEYKSIKNNFKELQSNKQIVIPQNKDIVDQVIFGTEFINENISYEELDTTLYGRKEKPQSESTYENSTVKEELKENNESYKEYDIPKNKFGNETSTFKNDYEANAEPNKQLDIPKSKTKDEHTTIRNNFQNVVHEDHEAKSYERYGITLSTVSYEHQTFKNDHKDKSESQGHHDILKTKSTNGQLQLENYLKNEGKSIGPHEISRCMCTHENANSKNQFKNTDVWNKYQETSSYRPHEISLTRETPKSPSTTAKIDLRSEENLQIIPPSWGAYRRQTETFSNEHYGDNESSRQSEKPRNQGTIKQLVSGFNLHKEKKSNGQYKTLQRKGNYEYPAPKIKFENGEDETHGYHELHPSKGIYDIRTQTFTNDPNKDYKLYGPQEVPQTMSTYEHQPKIAPNHKFLKEYKNPLSILTTERPKELFKVINDIDADDESYYEQLQDIPQKMSTHKPYPKPASNYFKREYGSYRQYDNPTTKEINNLKSHNQGAIPSRKETYEHLKETLINNLTGDDESFGERDIFRIKDINKYSVTKTNFENEHKLNDLNAIPPNMDTYEQQNEKPPVEHPNYIISRMNPLCEADKIYLRKRQTQPKSHQIYRSRYGIRTMPQTKISLRIRSEKERKQYPKTNFIENSAIHVQKAYEVYDGLNSIIRNNEKTYQHSKRSSLLKDFEVQFIDDLDDSDSDSTKDFYIDTTYIDSSDELPEQAGYLDEYETTPAVRLFKDRNKESKMNRSHSSTNADEPKANKQGDDLNVLNDNKNVYHKNNHKRQHDIFENIEYEELGPDEFIHNDDESNLQKFIEEFVLWKTANMMVHDYPTEERDELNTPNQHPMDRFYAKDDNRILDADEFHGDHKVISNRVPKYPKGANPFTYEKHNQSRRKSAVKNIADYIDDSHFDHNQDEEEKEHMVINTFEENIMNNEIPDIHEYSIHKRNKVSFSPYQDHYPAKYYTLKHKPGKSKSLKHFIANETVGKQKVNFNQSNKKKHIENLNNDVYDFMNNKSEIKVDSQKHLRISNTTGAAKNVTNMRKPEGSLVKVLKQNMTKGNSWQDIAISIQPLLHISKNISTSPIQDEELGTGYQEIEKPFLDELTTLSPKINDLHIKTTTKKSYRFARTTTDRISKRWPSVTTNLYNNYKYRPENNNLYKSPENLPVAMEKELHRIDHLEKYNDFRKVLTENPKEIDFKHDGTEDDGIDNVRRKKFLTRNQKSLLRNAKHNNTLSLWSKHNFKPLNDSGIPRLTISVFDKPRQRRSAASSNARKWVRKRNRLLCIVMKRVEQRHLVPHVQNTWGNRCNVLVFVTVAQGAIYEEDVWPYTRSVLKYIRKRHHNHAEWFLKTDIDSFVAIGNLKYNFLKYYSPKTPLFFGCSGAFDYKAFILSKKALSRLNSLGAKTKHCTKVQLDVGIGPCLDFLNIYGIYSSECDRGTKTVEQFLADADPQVVQPSGEEWALPQFHHNKIFLQHVSIGDMYLIDYHLHAMYHIFETKTAKTVMVRPRVAVPSFSEEGLVS